jgi:hypothetical protein
MRPIFELDSQPDTFKRLCSELGVASTQVQQEAPSSPAAATLSQLVALVSPTPSHRSNDLVSSSQRFSPLDDRPPLEDAAGDGEPESVLQQFAIRIEARRKAMRDKCAGLQAQIRELRAQISAEQLACNDDIAALQRERDEKLSS